MTQEYDLERMTAKIRALRENAEELKKLSTGMPAVEKNVDRILANVRMLEVNVSELTDVI